jgi:hypothetical protein
MLFSKANTTTLREIGIHFHRGLVLSRDKRGEIEAEGKVNATASGLSFDTTHRLISFMCNNVSLGVSRYQLLDI